MGLSKSKRFEVFRRDGFKCAYCRRDEQPLEVDHVQPRAAGGSDDLNNLVTACFDCNRGKRDRDLSASDLGPCANHMTFKQAHGWQETAYAFAYTGYWQHRFGEAPIWLYLSFRDDAYNFFPRQVFAAIDDVASIPIIAGSDVHDGRYRLVLERLAKVPLERRRTGLSPEDEELP